jgi:putative membrane protein
MTTTNWVAPQFFDLNAVENIDEEQKVTLNYTPPVILAPDATLKTNALLMAHEPEDSAEEAIKQQPNILPQKQYGLWTWLLMAMGSLLLLLTCVEMVIFLDRQYQHSFVLGTVFLLLISFITAVALSLTYRAYKNILQLKSVTKLQQEGSILLASNEHGQAMLYLNRIANLYTQREELRKPLSQFYAAVNDRHHDGEVYELFSQKVMAKLDQQAYQIVVQRSKETAILTMLSPMGFLDVILTLWRNTVLINNIATLYSGRPGFISSFMLFGTVLQNLLYADVSDAAADGVAELLGGSALSVFSAQMAQGLGSGVMTARVGLHAMRACRPMPFTETDKPRLRHVRREIIQSMKEAFAK